MKEVFKKTFVAFDGKEFDDKTACLNYEQSLATCHLNLRNFEIIFPMQDGLTTCRVYLIHSENEFNMFKEYVVHKLNGEEGYINYEGNGWYVVQSSDFYAEVMKLSSILQHWSRVLNAIHKKVIDMEEC